MTKKSDSSLIGLKMIDIPGDNTPEHILWAHVLDRAMMDYGNFFTWFVSHSAFTELKSDSYRSAMTKELRTLEWFFFSKDSVPHNLNWIIDHCYDGNEGLAQVIRRKIAEKYRDNLIEYQNSEYVKPYLSLLTKRDSTALPTKSVADSGTRRRFRLLH